MAERTDIDALLISALYGELTPADEARLSAHFESHPADRTALSELTRTRATVRESRILAVQLEPPQSVSALLLREAARRAPSRRQREEEGWFLRFTRAFMAHPAMAAAAMLVLVVGVAGTLYVRGHDQFAEATSPALSENSVTPSGTSASQAPAPEAPPVAAAPAVVAAPEVADDNKLVVKTGYGSADGSAYKVDLETEGRFAKPAAPAPAKDAVGAGPEGKAAPRDQLAREEAKVAAPKPSPIGKRMDKQGIAVEIPGPILVPKELDDEPAPRQAAPSRKLAKAESSAAGGDLDLKRSQSADAEAQDRAKAADERRTAPGGGAATPAPAMMPSSGAAVAAPATEPVTIQRERVGQSKEKGSGKQPPRPSVQAPAPASPAAAASAPAAAPPPPPPADSASAQRDGRRSSKADAADGKSADDKPADGKDTLDWAQRQKSQVVALVKANKCRAAANAAVAIYNRAPDYYAASVATDREIRPCLAYVNNERDRADRSRAAAKRAVSTDTPANAAPAPATK